MLLTGTERGDLERSRRRSAYRPGLCGQTGTKSLSGKNGKQMSKQVLRLIITSAPGEEEGGRGVRRHVGQLARH